MHDVLPPATGAARPAGFSRRALLGATAASLASAAFSAKGLAQTAAPKSDRGLPVTGSANPKLARYDALMSRFMREQRPPGAALAVTHAGRLAYARGFGYADLEKKEAVMPTSLFRIASVSKPFTAVAVFRLIEQGTLSLDDKVFSIVKIEPHLPAGARLDPRIAAITVRHCLQHTAGWDRKKGFDPTGAREAEATAKSLGINLPIRPEDVIRYTLGRPLDFDPGTAYAYSNFGYLVLGRVIEAVSGVDYGAFVTKEVLEPLGITRMRLGKNLLADRAKDEVKYYDTKQRTGRAISGPDIGKLVPLPYGVECLETMDANGGWIASVVDLVRFATAFDNPKRCPILNEKSIEAMLARPDGPAGFDQDGKPKEIYHACGWNVRPDPGRPGRVTKWHGGGLAGTEALLMCRSDGTNSAVLFNGDTTPDGKLFAGVIDPLLHGPANEIRDWPSGDLFDRYYPRRARRP